MTATDQHIRPNVDGEHDRVGTVDGGACLSGHCQTDFVANSCSYRWQGKKEPRKDHQAVYKNYPLASEKHKLAQRGITGDRIDTTRRRKLPERHYAESLRLPTHAHDWDLDGPRRGKGVAAAPSPAAKPDPGEEHIPEGENFTRWTWPYWANAHHIIPQANFRKAIDEISIPDADIRELVRVGLLRAQYNINQYYNVIYLPMDGEVGKVLQLPRHLSLGGGSELPDPRGFCDHPRYTAKVDAGLTPIIGEFIEAAVSAREGLGECEALKTVTLAKEQLEELSENVWKAIVAFGTKKPGMPLVDLPELVL